jgi:molecular chaperone DnaJ
MALNYYQLLGIPVDADQQQIRTVYRRMAKRCHPDTNRGSEAAAELFRQVNEAYRILSEEKTRGEYDRKLSLRLSQQTRDNKRSPQSRDPQQKFNRFMGSLLDAMFGPLGAPQPTAPKPQTPQTPRKPKGPVFNAVYHQAIEKEDSAYVRGEDGVIRKKPKKTQEQKPSGKRPPKSRFVL